MASLILDRPVRRGEALCVQTRLERVTPSAFDFVVTFDGGARDLDGRVAGAGACLWGNMEQYGDRRPLAHAFVALPDEQHAQVAEAWGCAAAIKILMAHANCSSRILFAGDNLAVVRFAAAQGFLKRPSMAGPLHTYLSRLSLTGHLSTWIAVRRRHNKAADALATHALSLALDLRERGLHGAHMTHGTGWPTHLALP